ncbi:MAG: oxidoreductase [Candidatus Hydrogenedentota bacterium]|nr:MAG: oxidoreductase [Candidatus Hydrogenedentota bacterium]
MRAIAIEKAGPPESLKIRQWPDPELKPGYVRIRVKAFGLNYADIEARKGQYYDAPKMPFIPGYEVAGIVEEKSDEVSNFKKGDRVLAFTPFGGYAEYVCVPEEAVYKLPKKMSFADGASIPVNFSTAWHALVHTGTLLKDDRVFIHACAGGVGLAAIQIAKLFGAEVYGSASTEEKIVVAKSYGLKEGINYKEQDFVKTAKAKWGEKSFDIILDPIGGEQLKKELCLLRAHGRVVLYGAAAFTDRGGLQALKLLPDFFSMITLNIIDLIKDSRGIYTVNMKRIGDERPALLRKHMEDIMQLFAKGKLKTVIHKIMPWEEISEAHRLMQNRKTIGKVVLLID